MPSFPNEDTEIHFETVLQPNTDKWVVFLNGMTQSTAHWRSISKKFQDYNVLTYDARGQGTTPVGDLDLTLEQHAYDLAILLKHLQIQHAHLVGFSHGARVALQFANDHPERVDRLVLVSATARPSALAKTIIRSWAEILKRGGMEAMSWCAVPDILGARYLQENERVIPGIIKASVQRNNAEGVAALLKGMIGYPDLADLAKGVEAPTLVISSDEDLLVTKAGAEELASLCHGQHREIVGVGHTIPIEAPEAFAEITLKFLGD